MTVMRVFLFVSLLLAIESGCAHPHPRKVSDESIAVQNAAVVSVSEPASEAGCHVLLHGGNAIDATVATAFALAVTFPEAGNIGGGGFMVIDPGKGKMPITIDYRETAPAAATADMFARPSDRTPYRMVGVPGTVRGLALAHQKYGRKPWRELLQPAIALAQDGFTLNADVADSLNKSLARPGAEADEMRRVLGKSDGGNWSAGDRLVQPQLAQTLRHIADQGPDAFYRGPIATAMVKTIHEGGGILNESDLSVYAAKFRQPIHGTFHGYDLYAPPLPTSGGICLVETLNILERFDLNQQDRWSPRTLHLMIEAMKRVFFDRARYLGDSDFVSTPSHLTSKEYAAQVGKEIDLTRATPSVSLAKGIIPIAGDGPHTTHFSVIDQTGMAVANTYTLEQPYGGRIMVPGYGFLLNNEMGDFNPQPGVTTARGQIGTPPNIIAPGKRMLSSICPLIVTRKGKIVMVSGSPGGRTIINTMFCVMVNRFEFNMPPRQTIDAPRMSHTWLPDSIAIEPALQRDHEEALAELRRMDHTFAEKSAKQGDAHSIFIAPDGTRHAIADQRRHGTAAGF
jgi:gamma-glutamyltranspeptidase/glutathione hydrolase